MIPIENFAGRLGNQMFAFAALFSLTRDLGIDYYCQDEKDIREIFGQGIGFLPYVSIM